MTTPQQPQPPQPAHPAHLELETLADLQADLLDPADVVAAEQHLDGCAQCRDLRAGLDDIRTTLGAAAETGPMPADVAQRLDDALAAAGREETDATASSATDPARTVVPLSSRQRPSWHTRFAQAAAVIVLLAAVGGIGYGAFSSGSGDNAKQVAGSAADSAGEGGGASREGAGDGAVRVSASGRDYTSATLRSAVPGMLSATVPKSGSENRIDDGRASGVPPGNAPTDAGSIARCAQSLAGEPVAPLAVDLAEFEHKPALVIVLRTPDDPASVDVFAVPPDCPTGQVLQFERVALP